MKDAEVAQELSTIHQGMSLERLQGKRSGNPSSYFERSFERFSHFTMGCAISFLALLIENRATTNSRK